ncbi:MAG: U32 family peptidase [Clostridia bacterium]|nr:U32 family peptidase [Clostridia bacterium]
MIKNCELLAPAGTPESLQTALHFGADAVYLGGPMLQLRAESAGFTFEQLQQAARDVHALGKRMYVTVNCFAENGEIDVLEEYGKNLLSAGADAAIVSDLGVLAELKEKVPELELHVSTQANCLNYKAAATWHKLGAKRVVLGREMRLDDIKMLREKTPDTLEIEAFVHGAMCMAYSGRCLLSSYISHRSGNRGDCTQPCRWNYYLVEEKRPDMYLPVIEDAGATAVLSSADLKCIDFLDKLADAGVTSFKIEGRMKTAFYVATVVNAYRHAMDGTAPLDVCEQELLCASHRPFDTGFYFGNVAKDPNNDGLYRSDCQFTARVLGSDENGIFIEQRNRFKVGDTLEILSPDSLGEKFVVTQITDMNGKKREDAHLVQEKLHIACPFALREGDILRKRTVQ